MIKSLKINSLKKPLAVFICLLVIISSTLVCSATGKEYKISAVDDMKITLADNMSAVTRESKQNDEYFKKFGLDYKITMQNFENGDIYLQGMSNDSALTLTVTMTKTDESEGIKNYNLLESDKMGEVITNFLAENEYDVCTPDQSADDSIIWLYLNANVRAADGNVSAYQAHTVYDGMIVNVTLQRNGKSVLESDYNIFMSIVGSINFGKESFSRVIVPMIITGCFIVFIILIIVAVVVLKFAKKKRKYSKNDKIISELADKYNLKEQRGNDRTGYAAGFEPDNDDEPEEEFMYIATSHAASGKQSKDYDNDTEHYSEDAFDDYESEEPIEVDESEIDRIISSRKALAAEEQEYKQELENEADEDINIYDRDSLKNADKPVDEENEEQEEENRAADNIAENEVEQENERFDIFGFSDEDDEQADEDAIEQDEFNNDEELVRQQARKTRFFDSEDFFDEAPKFEKGIITEKDIDGAEDYDVISEIEKKAEVVRKDSEEQERQGKSAAESVSAVFAGVKNFGTHCGYFCTNVYRAIKRKRTIAKKKKLEQERRECEQLRAEKQRRQRQLEKSGSLVQVHSRNDRRPPQRKPQQKSRPVSRQSRGSQRNSNRPRNGRY